MRKARSIVDGIAGYAYSANQLARSILIPGLAARVATGQTGANQFYGQLEGGYRVDIGGLAEAFVTPFARLQAYTGTQNGFTENGAQSLNLTVAGQTTNSLRTVIGAQLGGAMALGWREKLNAQFRLGWSHEFADTSRPVSASFVGAPSAPFATFGASPQRDGAVIGLAAQHRHRRGDLGLPALRGRHLRPGFQPRPHRRRAHDVVSSAMKPPWMDEPPVRTLLAALDGAGIAARFVGGCVRDWLLGRTVDDIDIAVDKPPETVMRALEAADIKVVPTGLSHGTVTAIVKGRPFEITTLRRDVETDGRRAVVAFTDDWRTDAGRRDFTFNALYADAAGTIYDYFDGRADLLAGRVRFIGDPDQRIAEDHLRVLRFFRFYAWFGKPPLDAEGFAPAAAMPARSASCRASASPRNCCACWPRRRRPTRWRRWPRPAPSITGCRNIPARTACAAWSSARTRPTRSAAWPRSSRRPRRRSPSA